MHEFLHILEHSLLDSIKLLPFLFIAFFIIELIEHKLSDKSKKVISKSGKYGPILGSLLGLIPQCGFSVVATNLYITRILSLGTLISIYLSTSDEMLVILLSRNASISTILPLLGTKFLVGLISGFIIDFLLRNKKKEKQTYSICVDEHCGCEEEENLLKSSFIHTIKTFIFIFIATFIITLVFELFGEEYLSKILLKDTLISPFITSLIGLIPNCASSVILTELYLSNSINFASVISGLLTGSGVAILVLFKSNKNIKENLTILSLVYGIGVITGIIITLISYII
ncbi:MAG: hypothetical protein E7171_04645 [Firmicutes bacterium]|nr:hypothetical protein [Bacillota bacterium]